MTRWWKCDLQIASPGARDFRGPPDPPWSIEDESGRLSAARRYMDRASEVGLEVLALADHNDTSWVTPMVEAGDEAGIALFPGVEITTGSGADGIHIILIGDRSKTTKDFEQILAGVCGFGPDHPRFDPTQGTPASAPRTLLDILDELPDDFLVVAPHVFNDNGLFSSKSLKGDLRWKALHHDRLNAVDVGDVRDIKNEESMRAKFARRELDNFPVLSGLAFVSTSDAYSLERLGERHTWIRMAAPTLEGLRQAFLDHEARIVCDWDQGHVASPTPNDIDHAWVSRATMAGLTTSSEPIEVEFDPRLTVIIGGRGSGKSTLVAALRLLYGDTDGLPAQAASEFSELCNAVFPNAELKAEHRLAHSQEEQAACWTERAGSNTLRPHIDPEAQTATDFKVRVVNQKELFERASHSATDPYATSRSLLSLVDDALATGSASPGGPAAFENDLDETQTAWISAARAHQSELEATAQRDVVAARVEELQRQVAAFDSPDTKSRRERNDALLAQRTWIDAALAALREGVEGLERDLDQRVPAAAPKPPRTDDENPAVATDLQAVSEELSGLREDLRSGIGATLAATAKAMEELDQEITDRPWGEAVAMGQADAVAYAGELEALGIDPAEYQRVRDRLRDEQSALGRLDERRAGLEELREAADTTWSALVAIVEKRQRRRERLLSDVEQRSDLLRFRVRPRADVAQWVDRVRDLLNLRADGFIEDVPALGRWLWEDGSETELSARQDAWRQACVTGDFENFGREARMKAAWQQRVAGLDAAIRARLGAEVADDVVEMEFLQEGGNPQEDEDWKPLTAGSPGQRSAAMLSFVMHHGIEPLVLDQPEDDLDTEWITQLVVRQLRTSRWTRQLIVVTHNANIPVNADAEQVVVLENHGRGIRIRRTAGSEDPHVGAIEDQDVRRDIQQIMEGGVAAFVGRERRYNNELNRYRAALRAITDPGF